MCKTESVRCNVDYLSPYFLYFATCAPYNMFILQHMHFACYNVHSAIHIELQDKSGGWIS